MKVKWFALLLGVLGIVAATGFAQNRAGGRRYDPKTETTVKGTISDVQQLTGKRGGRTGTHLVVKTEAGDAEVHVGPSSFVAKKQFSFAKGDAIELVGSKVVVGGKDVILAREIIKDGKTLVLRDAQGIPQWSGGRRGGN